MKLWIRSQDREVLLPAKLEMQATGSERIGYLMYGLKDYSASAVMLGTYKTKKRALEVLDEIQEYIEKQDSYELLVDDNGIANGSIYYGKVYQMPKE